MCSDAHSRTPRTTSALTCRQTQTRQLTYGLLESNVQRPEGWVSGSLYMELRDDRERALEYAEKALQLQPRHLQALLRCGHMHLDANKFDLALISFRKALEVSRTVRAYQGAVKSYIGVCVWVGGWVGVGGEGGGLQQLGLETRSYLCGQEMA